MFTLTNCPNLKEKLRSQNQALESDVNSLTKRLQYFEKTYHNCQEHMKRMLN